MFGNPAERNPTPRLQGKPPMSVTRTAAAITAVTAAPSRPLLRYSGATMTETPNPRRMADGVLYPTRTAAVLAATGIDWGSNWEPVVIPVTSTTSTYIRRESGGYIEEVNVETIGYRIKIGIKQPDPMTTRTNRITVPGGGLIDRAIRYGLQSYTDTEGMKALDDALENIGQEACIDDGDAPEYLPVGGVYNASDDED